MRINICNHANRAARTRVIQAVPLTSQGARHEVSVTDGPETDYPLVKVTILRPKAVERARKLVNDPDYPSSEVIARLGRLLAVRLAGPG